MIDLDWAYPLLAAAVLTVIASVIIFERYFWPVRRNYFLATSIFDRQEIGRQLRGWALLMLGLCALCIGLGSLAVDAAPNHEIVTRSAQAFDNMSMAAIIIVVVLFLEPAIRPR